MIGLGSNRLTCCRRGGMSVTQAGRGGMEWLAGGRVPRWASPYSEAATAYLKENYGSYWSAIQQFGFNNPTMVSYINEDPDVICSVVNVGKIRKIVGPNNASNYFTLPWCNTNKTEIEMEFCVERTDNYVILSTYQTRIFGLSSNNYAGWATNRVQYSYSYVVGTKYVGVFNSTSMKVNGTTIGGVGSSYGTNKMCVGHDYQNGGIANNIDIVSLKWKEDGVQVGWFVPFVRDDKVELLNLVTGELATRTGTLTISETPAS